MLEEELRRIRETGSRSGAGAAASGAGADGAACPQSVNAFAWACSTARAAGGGATRNAEPGRRAGIASGRGAKTSTSAEPGVGPGRSATATSGLTVTITSTTTSICAINGFDVTLLATGTCSLTATQSGDQNVKSAQAVTRTFVISKASQTITFAKPANHTLLETPFTVEAAASSALSVTLASTTTGVCTVNGFDITLLAAGSCSLATGS